MQTKSTKLISLIIILITFGIAFYYYPSLPDKIVSHWGISGEADGFMPKAFGIFFVPILMVIFTAVFWIIPKLDPLKKNIESFSKYFNGFILVFQLFFLYVYILTIVFNLGHTFNMLAFLMPAFAILFYYLGVMIGKAKRNYFIGIRTPWTLNSDQVWDKTHKLGSLLFKLSAIPFLVSIFWPIIGFSFFMCYIIGISLWLVVYSYFEFSKEQKQK